MLPIIEYHSSDQTSYSHNPYTGNRISFNEFCLVLTESGIINYVWFFEQVTTDFVPMISIS